MTPHGSAEIKSLLSQTLRFSTLGPVIMKYGPPRPNLSRWWARCNFVSFRGTPNRRHHHWGRCRRCHPARGRKKRKEEREGVNDCAQINGYYFNQFTFPSWSAVNGNDKSRPALFAMGPLFDSYERHVTPNVDCQKRELRRETHRSAVLF